MPPQITQCFLVKSREYGTDKDSTGRETIIACYAQQEDATLRAEAEIRRLYNNAHQDPPNVLFHSDTGGCFVDLKGTREDRVLIYVARMEILGCYGGKNKEEETDVNIEFYEGEFEDHEDARIESGSSSEEDIRPDPLSPLRVRPTTNFTPLNSSPSAGTSHRAVFSSPARARDVSPSPINSFRGPFRGPVRKSSPIAVRTRSPLPDFKFPARNASPSDWDDVKLPVLKFSSVNSLTADFKIAARDPLPIESHRAEWTFPTLEPAPADSLMADPKVPAREMSLSPINLDDALPPPLTLHTNLSSPLRETVVKNLAMLPASTPPQFRIMRRSAE